MMQTNQHPEPGEEAKTVDDAMGRGRAAIDPGVAVACQMESLLEDLEVEQKEHDGDGEEEQDAPRRHAHLLAQPAGEEAAVLAEVLNSRWWREKKRRNR
jgi:hypothetical protein